ncbi:HU family DNA-binding protein [Croceicoccus sp. F390]|uniref:HU family DNA-binding protein n=1 Tax=Croceicoccus esteveae TaxID=3075597 RepID=A0ABU2ZJA3_9SPHN|nr:HU family DNA-binding protein [Croceicoccus sp. F390]MDT0576108.1 HU family DNA-binding protein [Croceicoccus sp. F390]
MNIAELSKKVAAATDMNDTDAKSAVQAVFEQIAQAAAEGEEVAVPGFGKFTVKDRPARKGRNPSTGEEIDIAASKKVAFTAAKGLKDRL